MGPALEPAKAKLAKEPSMITLEEFSNRAASQDGARQSKLTAQTFVSALEGITTLYLGEASRQKVLDLTIRTNQGFASDAVPEKKILLAIEENAAVRRSVSKRVLAVIGATVREYAKEHPKTSFKLSYLGTIEQSDSNNAVYTLHFKRSGAR